MNQPFTKTLNTLFQRRVQMATYVLSDLHGNYPGYLHMLEAIEFSSSDTLYVNGDVLDRGSEGIKILQHMMLEPNIFPILGNHEYMAYHCLRTLLHTITSESIDKLDSSIVEEIVEWQNVGGIETIMEFQALDNDERENIIEYLEEFTLYEEVVVNQHTFVIVHAGLDNFTIDRPLSGYQLHELIFNSPDYNQLYYPDKYLVTGHCPTRAIDVNPVPDEIFIHKNHIAIDCGSGYGLGLGCIYLDNFECFYV